MTSRFLSRLLPLCKTGLLLSPFIALASCSTEKDLEQCPAAAILADASSLVAFGPAATRDTSNQLYRIAATNVITDCDADKVASTATSSIRIHFRASRLVTAPELQYTLPYFVSVTLGDQIIFKQMHALQFTFAAGQAVTDATDSVGSILINVAKDKKPADYEILVGLQLSKEQLDYNRKMGRYMP